MFLHCSLLSWIQSVCFSMLSTSIYCWWPLALFLLLLPLWCSMLVCLSLLPLDMTKIFKLFLMFVIISIFCFSWFRFALISVRGIHPILLYMHISLALIFFSILLLMLMYTTEQCGAYIIFNGSQLQLLYYMKFCSLCWMYCFTTSIPVLVFLSWLGAISLTTRTSLMSKYGTV